MAPPDDAADPLIGTEIGGHQVISPQPEMGTGDNYLGVEPQSGTRVSIKVLPSRLSTDAKYTDRLMKETKLLEALDHERIARILGYGKTTDRRHYVITEFLEGNSLQRLITREAPISPGRTLQLAEQILEALSGAHGVGVVHRDLKPTNIILLGQAGKRKVKLIDFALAKGGTSFDSPEYSAPENMRTAAPAPPADLYSLGVILFELLTGKLPFNGATPPELVKMHMLTPAPRVCETAPAVPKALDDLVAKLLSKSPEARGGPAEAVRAQVLQILAELPDRPTGEQPRPTEAVTAITAPGAPNFKHHESPTRRVDAEEIARVLEEPAGDDDEKTAIATPNEAGGKAEETRKKPSEALTRKLSADEELKKAAELLKASKKEVEARRPEPSPQPPKPPEPAPPPKAPEPAPAPAAAEAAPPPKPAALAAVPTPSPAAVPAPAPAAAPAPAPAPVAVPAPAPAPVAVPAPAPAPAPAAVPAPVQAAPPPPKPLEPAPQPPPPAFAPAPPRARAAPTPIPGDLLLPPLGAPPPAPVAAPEPKKPPRASPPTTVHLHDDEPPKSSKLPAIIGGAVVVLGLGVFAILQLTARPNPNSTAAVVAAVKSKPKEPEVPPPPPKKSAAERCTNLEKWKGDAEDQLRVGARKYLRTAPSVKSPAMDALNAILADSRKVKTTERCIEVQNAIDAWEAANVAGK